MNIRLMVKPVYSFLILIATVLLISGCGQDQEYSAKWLTDEEMCKVVKDINMSDGINEKESKILADVYFQRFTPSACGCAGFPIDKEDYWDVPVAIGYAGMPFGSIKINKKTARMSWENGPTIENPVNYFCLKN
jgi:hypothetical protein